MTELDSRSRLPKLLKYFGTNAERESAVFAINQAMRYIDIESIITDSSDPDDNKFLELALDGQAKFIVSGDSDLRTLDPWRGIAILSTGEFVRGHGTP